MWRWSARLPDRHAAGGRRSRKWLVQDLIEDRKWTMEAWRVPAPLARQVSKMGYALETGCRQKPLYCLGAWVYVHECGSNQSPSQVQFSRYVRNQTVKTWAQAAQHITPTWLNFKENMATVQVPMGKQDKVIVFFHYYECTGTLKALRHIFVPKLFCHPN